MFRMLSMLARMFSKSVGIDGYPRFVTFNVTWRCNCKCVMCDIWRKGNSYELTINEIKHVFSQLPSLDCIRITGGEPFLRDDLAEILEEVKERSNPSVIHITTNGLLTERICQVVKDVKPNRPFHFKVSIDAIGEKHDSIRGVSGAFDQATETVKMLKELSRQFGFYVGIDQTIIDKNGIEAYYKLREIGSKIGVSIHPVIAYDKNTALYSRDKVIITPSNSVQAFGEFNKDDLARFLQQLVAESKEIKDLKERATKLFYLTGLYNRLIAGKPQPNPKCVALDAHLRILPDGTVPVCLYNSQVAGDLKTTLLKEIWASSQKRKLRAWTKKCSGCWAGCESNVNGIYSGALIASAFFGAWKKIQ